MSSLGAVAFNVLQGTGVIVIENGYAVRAAAKYFGGKFYASGVGEVIKDKSWVISTQNEDTARKAVKALKKVARGIDLKAQVRVATIPLCGRSFIIRPRAVCLLGRFG